MKPHLIKNANFKTEPTFNLIENETNTFVNKTQSQTESSKSHKKLWWLALPAFIVFTMKLNYSIIIISLLCTVTSYADETIDTMIKTLTDGGITNLAVWIKESKTPSPFIPSKWYVENRLKKSDEKDSANKIRDFGLQLAKEFDTTSVDFQKMEANDDLCDLTFAMCDISDWCGETVGYGNILLAER